jgi:hypothetical protein
MRDVLLAHLDGAVVKIPDPHECSGPASNIALSRRATTMALLDRGYLCKAPSRFRCTVITEEGRSKLAELLAEYAEVLLRVRPYVAELTAPIQPAAQPLGHELQPGEQR